MLVVSRRDQETVHIGDDVTIQIVRIEKGSVRIGISAPRKTLISRGELGKPKLTDAALAQVNGSDQDGPTRAGLLDVDRLTTLEAGVMDVVEAYMESNPFYADKPEEFQVWMERQLVNHFVSFCDQFEADETKDYDAERWEG